jgi:hypothetical protein
MIENIDYQWRPEPTKKNGVKPKGHTSRVLNS